MIETKMLDLIQQIIAGLWAMHCQSITHRNLSPENVLMFENNTYKLSDPDPFDELKKDNILENRPIECL